MTGATIHILDDDVPFRDSLAFMLSAHGFLVATHGDPGEFLRTLEDRRSNCLICDVRMPGMSGIEVTRTLRAHGHEIPVILVTGHADAALIDHAMQAGATLVLEKPFPPQQLIEALNELIDPKET